MAYAQIDWHDFVVVETVDYQPTETGNLPPPTTPDEVGARMLLQQRYEEGEPVPLVSWHLLCCLLWIIINSLFRDFVLSQTYYMDFTSLLFHCRSWIQVVYYECCVWEEYYPYSCYIPPYLFVTWCYFLQPLINLCWCLWCLWCFYVIFIWDHVLMVSEIWEQSVVPIQVLGQRPWPVWRHDPSFDHLHLLLVVQDSIGVNLG